MREGRRCRTARRWVARYDVAARFGIAVAVALGGAASPTAATLEPCPPGTALVEDVDSYDPKLIGTFDEVCPNGCPARWCARRDPSGTMVREGPFESARETGEPNAHGFYRDGKRHGRWIAWYASGARRYLGGWRGDQKSGKWAFWYEDGTLEGEGRFRDDEYDGPWTWWYTNGRPHLQGVYERGRPSGPWKVWNENGTLLATGPIVGTEPWPEPQRVTVLPRHQLSEEFRPLALHGGEYVARRRDWDDSELYLIDVATGRASQLTHDGTRKGSAVLSDRWIAWTAVVPAEPTPESSPGAPRELKPDGANVFVQDRRDGRTRILTTGSAARSGLALDGDWLVWADRRNEEHGGFYDADVYAYDLVHDVERPVAVAPGSQQNPDVHGHLVVWEDNRESSLRDQFVGSCDSCPGSRFDIRLYDLGTGEERALAADARTKVHPRIFGRRVAWMTYENRRPTTIELLDLASGAVRRVNDDATPAGAPVLTATHLLWSAATSCDVLPHPPNLGVFVQDLDARRTYKLTDFVEPSAWIDGGTVLIEETCMMPGPVYTVRLDDMRSR